MHGFIGRETEISVLEGFMENPAVHGCAVYGIRSVGKTSLLRRFTEDRRSVYIQLIGGSEASIVQAAVPQIPPGLIAGDPPTTLVGLLDILGSICLREPTLIVLDEYPYLSSSVPHADSALQAFMDGPVGDSGSKVIICGSRLSSMLEIVRDSSNPLYNRFRMTLEVRPLSFEDTCRFHPAMGDADLVRMHMTFGGMPAEHRIFDGDSYRQAVIGRLLARGLPYGEMARARIGSELGNADAHESIVRSVARGRTRLKDISESTGISMSSCSSRISDLESIGILERVHPMAGAPTRPSYRISDGLVGLWYTVFDGVDDLLLPQDVESRCDMYSGRVDTFMGHRFERFCASFLASHYSCLEIGTWWGMEADGSGDREWVDIDIVAKVEERGRRGTVYCECKFRNRMTEMSDLETLERRARRLDDTANLVLFSMGGFERELVALAREHGAVLIGPDEIMGRRPAPNLLSL